MKTEQETVAELPASVLVKHQVKTFKKPITYYGKPATITAEVRYDDECGNGHNTFSITGEIWEKGARDAATGGCIHDEIAKHFPQLAPLIKWHLVSSDGPMHYLANVTFHAGNRDCWGCLKGEPRSYERAIKFQGFLLQWAGHRAESFLKWIETMGTKAADCEVLAIEHKGDTNYGHKFAPKWTLGGFADKWHECPFDTEREALQFVEALKGGFEIVKRPDSWGEGKERDFAAARSTAVWPEATDEQLSLPKDELTALLLACLPALMAEFKSAVESLGFVY